jgi:urease accessory protein UreF
VDKNDLEALRAAFRGVKTTAAKLGQMDAAVEQAASATAEQPPSDLMRAATAHAIAAAAFSGLLHRLFTSGGVAPKTMELTDSSGESGT